MGGKLGTDELECSAKEIWTPISTQRLNAAEPQPKKEKVITADFTDFTDKSSFPSVSSAKSVVKNSCFNCAILTNSTAMNLRRRSRNQNALQQDLNRG
jgi:hypothetical protein